MIRSFVAILIALALASPASLFAQADAKRTDGPKPSASAAKDGAAKSDDGRPKKADDRKPDAKKSDDKPTDERKFEEKKPEERRGSRDALAKSFAKEHHPELASLLRVLETMSPEAYESAVRDVARAAERLETMKERDPERYERELDVWKTRSRVHVVSAEYRLNPGADLETKLRELMQDELRAKRELLIFEQHRTERRLEQIEREIRQIDEKGSDLIDRQIGRLPQSPASAPNPKPAPRTKPKT